MAVAPTPVVDVAVVPKAPVKVSDPTKPRLVPTPSAATVYVRLGFASPYTRVCASAVTVIGRGVMVYVFEPLTVIVAPIFEPILPVPMTVADWTLLALVDAAPMAAFHVKLASTLLEVAAATPKPPVEPVTATVALLALLSHASALAES